MTAIVTEVRLILLMTAVLFALVVAFWVEVVAFCAFTSGICEMADIEIDGLTSDSLLQILRLLII